MGWALRVSPDHGVAGTCRLEGGQGFAGQTGKAGKSLRKQNADSRRAWVTSETNQVFNLVCSRDQRVTRAGDCRDTSTIGSKVGKIEQTPAPVMAILCARSKILVLERVHNDPSI